MPRVAAVQAKPECFNLDAGLASAARWVAEARQAGCQMAVFPETWLGGYPAWLDCCRDAALWDHPPAKRIHQRLIENSIEVPGPAVTRLSEIAKEAGIVLNISAHERVRGTLYNTMLTFDAVGTLVLHHRKIMPTFTERMIWGAGDGSSLHAASTAAVRITGCHGGVAHSFGSTGWPS